MKHKPMTIQQFLDQILGADRAFLPYYPEMLDFDLLENLTHETKEIQEYHESFARNIDM